MVLILRIKWSEKLLVIYGVVIVYNFKVLGWVQILML